MAKLEAFEILKEYLLQNFPDSKVTRGGKELVKKCHYCGDSKKADSKHLYIGVNDKGVISYHCFKCNAGGVVGPKFFRDLGIYDSTLINMVTESNNKASNIKSTNIDYGNYDNVKFYAAPVWDYVSDDRNLKKLAYVNNRLGTQFTLRDLERLKIVLNIREFLTKNGIRFFSRHPDVMNDLDMGFIGFLSMDNSHIVLRRLVPEEKVHPTIHERYTIYNIYNEAYKGVTYYAIPGQINPFIPANVVVTEGPFDILSVYSNLPKYPNAIYASATGKAGYVNLLDYIFYILKVSMIGSTIHVYSDNDITSKDIGILRSYAESKDISMNIHFNLFTGEKDYGVKGDHIIDSNKTMYRSRSYNYIDFDYNPFSKRIEINGFKFNPI